MIIELLQAHSWEGVSETIEIAKGKYKLPQTLKEGYNQLRREWQSKKQ